LQFKAVGGSTSVDLVRAVAIILIVFLHATAFPYITQSNSTMEVSTWWTVDVYGAIGPMGLPLFVMLSGALLLDKSKGDEPMRVFFKKRFNRIGLPMIFWTIFYFVWSFAHGTAVTINSILQGVISGSYNHLWFLYLLIGLYLVTPFLRVLVNHLDQRKFFYLLAICFVGTIIVPILQYFETAYNPVMFILTGWVGYFLLGRFLLGVKMPNKWILVGAVTFGVAVSIFGTFQVMAVAGQSYATAMHESLSFNFIIASAAMFLLLTAIPASKIQTHSLINRLIGWISRNTLPIYLLHIVVFEIFEYNYLGVEISVHSMNPIVSIPLLALVTFVLTSLIVYAVKKIPYAERIIG
jgi:surface polysaccharide O-acyltransferase-like enzyme